MGPLLQPGEVKAEKPEKSWCRHSGSGEQETGADLEKKWKEQLLRC